MFVAVLRLFPSVKIGMTEEDIVILVKYLKLVGKYINWLLSAIAGEFKSYPRLRYQALSV